MKLIFLIVIVSLVTCGTLERRTRVKLTGGNPPTFVLSGSGELADMIIYGPKQRDSGAGVGDRAFAIWEIKPVGGHYDGRLVEDLASIKYGIVPKGYEQVYPEKEMSPPALVVGEKYEYWFQTINAPHARAYFEIRDNKAVELPK